MINQDEATEWLEKNAPHIKIFEWSGNASKSKFIDIDRGVEFEYRFSNIKKKIKANPSNLFGASKEEVQEKRRQTNIERYGVESPAQNKVVQEKIKRTNLERYGCERPAQNKEIQEKMKQTNLERIGVENPFQSKEIQARIRQSSLEKYGVENLFQNGGIQKKQRRTVIERYGVENPFQSKEIQEKQRRTMIERYGVEYPAQNKNIQEKIIQTNIEKYGVGCPLQNKEVQEKTKQTNFEKYGVEHPLQNKGVQEKIKKTNLEKYGVEWNLQNKKVQQKIRQTNIKNGNIVIINGETLKEVAIKRGCGYTTLQQFHKKFGATAVENYEKKQYQSQEYVAETIREVLPNQEVLIERSTPWKTDKNYSQRFDVFVPELNLAVEYHGKQHYEPIEYFGGDKTFAKTRKLDSYKREMCKKNGIKLIEIKYDELKYDESDIEMIKEKIEACKVD